MGLACQVCGATQHEASPASGVLGKTCNGQVLFLDFVSCPICMATLLHQKIVLAFLGKLRFARDYAKRCLDRLSLLLAFLASRRNFSKWWHSRPGKPGKSQILKPADPSFLCTEADSYSVSGRPTIVIQCTVAASSVPASASLPSLHERQLATTAPMVGTPTAPGRDPVNRRSASIGSTQSRASDRHSIISTSRDSSRVTHNEPSRHSSRVHRQFGRGPDPSSSSERITRPGTPTRPHTPLSPPHLEIVTSPPSAAHESDSVSPLVPPSASSAYTHQPLSQSSTSFVVDVQFPSTDSLPISPSTTNPSISEEPLPIESATAHPSPDSDSPVVNQHDEPPGSPKSSNPATLDYYWPEGRFVQLINSDQTPRYAREALIPRTVTSYDVKPLTTTFPYFPEPNGFEQDPMIQPDCSPWVPATHPDGGLYFYDEERRLFTDTDMHNSTMREEIECFYNHLQRFIRIGELLIPSKNYDLVLDIMAIDDKIWWSYYYACHEARCLFWLETYDASYMTFELSGVKSPAHIKHRMESLYWTHWSLFPVAFEHRCLPFDIYDELMGILIHGCIDVMTSKCSTLPYDDDTMRRMIRLVQAAKDATGSLAYYNAGITRLLSFFAHWRFLYFHGQTHARLIQDRSVYDKPRRERSLLITLLSPLLFLAPDSYLRDMEKIWTDDIIREPDWRWFITKLLAQWESVILWSTVMLSANVGFLAIPGVVLSNISGSNLTSTSQMTIFTSPTQIASCLSVLASIASIVVGMPLLRRHMTKGRNDPAGASMYLYHNTHSAFGLEPMAVIFSLPWALLMWSMATFFVALLLFCFTISNKATRISVAAMSMMVVALVVWSIKALESKLAEEVFHNNLAVLRRSRHRFSAYLNRLFRTRHPVTQDSIQMPVRQSGVV